MEERRELVKQAIPLYVDLLSSLPFYQAWGNDERHWRPYIMSRINQARDMVAHSIAQGNSVELNRSIGSDRDV